MMRIRIILNLTQLRIMLSKICICKSVCEYVFIFYCENAKEWNFLVILYLYIQLEKVLTNYHPILYTFQQCMSVLVAMHA